MDIAFDQLFVKPVVEGLVFYLGHGVDIATNGVGYSCLEVDSMVPRPLLRESL